MFKLCGCLLCCTPWIFVVNTLFHGGAAWSSSLTCLLNCLCCLGLSIWVRPLPLLFCLTGVWYCSSSTNTTYNTWEVAWPTMLNVQQYCNIHVRGFGWGSCWSVWNLSEDWNRSEAPKQSRQEFLRLELLYLVIEDYKIHLVLWGTRCSILVKLLAYLYKRKVWLVLCLILYWYQNNK